MTRAAKDKESNFGVVPAQRHCLDCDTTETPVWRCGDRFGRPGLMCNACWLYRQRHHRIRPVTLASDALSNGVPSQEGDRFGGSDDDLHNAPDGGPCVDCKTTESPQWRSGERWGVGALCNACGIYRQRHARARPGGPSTTLAKIAAVRRKTSVYNKYSPSRPSSAESSPSLDGLVSHAAPMRAHAFKAKERYEMVPDAARSSFDALLAAAGEVSRGASPALPSTTPSPAHARPIKFSNDGLVTIERKSSPTLMQQVPVSAPFRRSPVRTSPVDPTLQASVVPAAAQPPQHAQPQPSLLPQMTPLGPMSAYMSGPMSGAQMHQAMSQLAAAGQLVNTPSYMGATQQPFMGWACMWVPAGSAWPMTPGSYPGLPQQPMPPHLQQSISAMPQQMMRPGFMYHS